MQYIEYIRTNKMFHYVRSLQHKNSTVTSINEGIQLLEAVIKDRIASFRILGTVHTIILRNILNI